MGSVQEATVDPGTLRVRDVAAYLLTLADEEVGDAITNLKLQKLVYYAQGFHLALFDKPLFAEQLEAWDHGPVVPELYRSFKQHRAEPIPAPEGLDVEQFPKDVIDLLDEVYQVYGQFSASKLRNMTHNEAPWREAYDISPSTIISHESMKEYFKTQIVTAS